jgi:hypothetical protein
MPNNKTKYKTANANKIQGFMMQQLSQPLAVTKMADPITL